MFYVFKKEYATFFISYSETYHYYQQYVGMFPGIVWVKQQLISLPAEDSYLHISISYEYNGTKYMGRTSAKFQAKILMMFCSTCIWLTYAHGQFYRHSNFYQINQFTDRAVVLHSYNKGILKLLTFAKCITSISTWLV